LNHLFKTRSWIAFVSVFLALYAGYIQTLKYNCDWKVYGVFALGMLLAQVILTGRSVLADVVDGVKAWKGIPSEPRKD